MKNVLNISAPWTRLVSEREKSRSDFEDAETRTFPAGRVSRDSDPGGRGVRRERRDGSRMHPLGHLQSYVYYFSGAGQREMRMWAGRGGRRVRIFMTVRC